MLSKYRASLQSFIVFVLGQLWILAAVANTHHPQDFLNEIKGSKDEGRAIYQHFCALCHDIKPQIPVGAPRAQISEDWGIRVTKGLDSLIKNTHNGLGVMPPRGGCFECTDDQLLAAIRYMLPKKTWSHQHSEYK